MHAASGSQGAKAQVRDPVTGIGECSISREDAGSDYMHHCLVENLVNHTDCGSGQEIQQSKGSGRLP